MDIQTTTNYTITINGVSYDFADPHPIVDLISALDAQRQELALWNQRVADTTAAIADIQARISAACVNPSAV